MSLSENEAKLYVHIATKGPNTVKNLTDEMKINKRQMYRILSKLQKKRLIMTDRERPAKFSGITFERALEILIKNKEEQAKSLELRKEELISDFLN